MEKRVLLGREEFSDDLALAVLGSHLLHLEMSLPDLPAVRFFPTYSPLGPQAWSREAKVRQVTWGLHSSAPRQRDIQPSALQ